MVDLALLAPVPEKHLISGLKTCAQQGKVAFGTRSFEPFARLRDAKAIGCDVYLYASHSAEPGPPKASWKGRYLGYVDAKNGAHPEGMKFRPETTLEGETDNKGHWFLFWEISDLRKLDEGEARLISHLRGETSKSNYKAAFIPEGPLVIQAPS